MVIDRVTEMLKTLPKDWSAGKYKVVFLLFLLCSCNDNLPDFLKKYENGKMRVVHTYIDSTMVWKLIK